MNRKKILYFVTEDWYFCSHRMPLALAAQEAGYDVSVLTHVDKHGELIRQTGIRLIPFNIIRQRMNIISEMGVLARLIVHYRREKPNVVHHVAMKPVLYGSLAARLSGVSCVVNALAGLGFVFTSDKLASHLLRPFVGSAFRKLLNGRKSLLILQNQDDRALFIRKQYVHEMRIRLIRGSGVDTAVYLPIPEPIGIPTVMLASRMLSDKGIKEFVEAAKLLKNRGLKVRFVLVGDTDTHNPSAITKEQLISWHTEGAIEWWGVRDDMQAVLAQAHVVCLPSFREGLPKVLLEAASIGRPIVTTNTPGCREVVRNGENGFLVPVRSIVGLADSIQILIEKPELRREMGVRGRQIAISEFSVNKVVSETIEVYEELLRQ